MTTATSTLTTMSTESTLTPTDALLPDNVRPHILVVGLGNFLLQDDGVGVHAALALQQDAPPGVCAVEVGTAVLDALHLFEWADKIIAVDAMQAGGEPGTVYKFREEDIADSGAPVSLHEVSIKAALRFLPEPVTAEMVFLGVEPSVIDYGLDLTPRVEAALPTVLHAARELIADWQGSACS